MDGKEIKKEELQHNVNSTGEEDKSIKSKKTRQLSDDAVQLQPNPKQLKENNTTPVRKKSFVRLRNNSCSNENILQNFQTPPCETQVKKPAAATAISNTKSTSVGISNSSGKV